MKGRIVKTDKSVTSLKDTFIYIKSGNNFLKYITSNGNGLYEINSFQQGNAKVIVDRLGYSSDSISMSLV